MYIINCKDNKIFSQPSVKMCGLIFYYHFIWLYNSERCSSKFSCGLHDSWI